MFNLIIIDDESFGLKILSESITWQDYDFGLSAIFTDGKDALEYLASHHVDLVITDIKLNDISGIDIARYCYENLPSTYVVLISGYRDFSYAKYAIKYQVKDYLTKPINYNELIQTIKSVRGLLSEGKSDIQQNQGDSLILNAIDFIEKNYSDKITSNDVAAHVALSPSYFRLYFKSHTGENFSDYIYHYRMNAAKKLLLTTNMSVYSICEEVGYKNRTHFYNMFQEYVGCSPTEFRLKSKDKE